MSLNQPIVNILFNCGLVLVIVVGAYRVQSKAIQVGVIVAFFKLFYNNTYSHEISHKAIYTLF